MKESYWDTDYVCHNCGEHSSNKLIKCSFCGAKMTNGTDFICKYKEDRSCHKRCTGFDIMRDCYEV